MTRMLLCSMSVPWPERQLLGAYHVDQALALRELGVNMELFSPALPGRRVAVSLVIL